MPLFERIERVVRTNLNEMVSKAQEPEKLLERVIADSLNDLMQLRQALANAIANQKQTYKQYERCSTEANNWQHKAQLALQNGDENLAREALLQKKIHAENVINLKQKLETETSHVEALKRHLVALENKIIEAKKKKNEFKGRGQAATTNKQLQKTLASMPNHNAITLFDRKQEKVLQMEARSQSITDSGEPRLEDLIQSLGEESHMNEWLHNKKEQLTHSSQPQQSVISANNPGEIIDQAIRELEDGIASAIASQQETRQQYDVAKKEAKNWQKNVLDGLLQDDDNLTLQAIICKTVQGKVAAALRTQLEEQESTVKLLKRNLAALETLKNLLVGDREASEKEETMSDATDEDPRSLLSDSTASRPRFERKLQQLPRQVQSR